MIPEEQLRRELLQTSHLLHQYGWVANHDGNISARLQKGLLLCTPTAVSKRDVTPEMLIVVDGENQVQQGTRKSFSELRLHRAAYEARPDIGCVIHAHPPTATGFCVANRSLGAHFMAEPVVSLGKSIPMLPFMLPNDALLFPKMAEALKEADVVMLANHGVLAVGGSFEQALLRLELVEHLAKIALVAHQLGGPVPIPVHIVEALSQNGRPKSEPCFQSQSSVKADKSDAVKGVFTPSSNTRPNLDALIKQDQSRYR